MLIIPEKYDDYSIDVILVSDAKNGSLQRLTSLAIESAGPNNNIIVIESNNKVFYERASLTIHPEQPFNYNRYLNIGAAAGTGKHIFFGNNDLIFIGDWAKQIVGEMNKHNVVSASPFSPKMNVSDITSYYGEVFFGYDLVSTFCGWAFVWRRDFYNQVGGLDEDFTFWCSDNAVVNQLKNNHQRHMLVTSSLVFHFGRTTLAHLTASQQYQYTVLEIAKYNEKFNTNLWDSPHIKGS